MKLKLCRLSTEAGVQLVFSFDVEGSYFLVKNFTGGNIYVSFEADDPNKILIPAETAQYIHFGWGDLWNFGRTNKIYVLPDVTSNVGVEIQCLRW